VTEAVTEEGAAVETAVVTEEAAEKEAEMAEPKGVLVAVGRGEVQ